MPADRDRISFDKQQAYRATVAQQGRVTLAADTNEAQEILLDENREQLLDVVGEVGTPDDGYALSFPGGIEIGVGAGTMYVGGNRVTLPAPITYSNQPDWLTRPNATNQNREYVFLRLEEREISATEDSALREIALGGPDTAQRLRILQRIVRTPTTVSTCADALTQQIAAWQAVGWAFIPETMRLESVARLQIRFANAGGATDPCEPSASGGFLGAENQMIRIRMTAPNRFVWGWDNASFLYRVDVVDNTTVKLQVPPPDTFHYPASGQVVELLASEARLANGEYVAAGEGTLFTLNANYVPESQSLTLPSAIPAGLIPPNGTPRLFLRVWQKDVVFTSGNFTAIGNTGLEAAITAPAGIHTGDFWAFAARPGAPTQVFPARYLTAPQPPEGPKLWVCPLGIVGFAVSPTGGGNPLISDCREHFDNLVELTKRKSGGGCCTVTVTVDQLANTTLDQVIQGLPGDVPAKICMAPGRYVLRAPVTITRVDLTIEACPGGVIIAAGESPVFRFGMFLLLRGAGVTFEGIRFEIREFGVSERPLFALNKAELDKLGVVAPDEFTTAIGIRSVDADQVIVKRCVFFSTEVRARSHFGAAILGCGNTKALRVVSCEFTDSTEGKQVIAINRTDLRVRAGVVFTHTIRAKVVAIPGAIDSLSGDLAGATLETLELNANRFRGLTAACFVQAQMKDVRVSDNSVRQAYSGIWILAAHPLTNLQKTLTENPDLANSLPTNIFLNDVALRSLSSIGRGLETPGFPAIRVPFVGVILPGQFAFPPPPPVGEDLLLRLHRMFALTNLIEQTAFKDPLLSAPDIFISCNLVECLITVTLGNLVTTGSAATIWFDDFVTASTATLPDTGTLVESGNQLTAQLPQGTVAVVALPSCATATGNVILNMGASGDNKNSLILFPVRGNIARIAITGNVFGGNLRAPVRVGMPAPLNAWEVLNTEFF